MIRNLTYYIMPFLGTWLCFQRWIRFSTLCTPTLCYHVAMRTRTTRPNSGSTRFHKDLTQLFTGVLERTFHFNTETTLPALNFGLNRNTNIIGDIIVCHVHHISMLGVNLFLHLQNKKTLSEGTTVRNNGCLYGVILFGPCEGHRSIARIDAAYPSSETVATDPRDFQGEFGFVVGKVAYSEMYALDTVAVTACLEVKTTCVLFLTCFVFHSPDLCVVVFFVMTHGNFKWVSPTRYATIGTCIIRSAFASKISVTTVRSSHWIYEYENVTKFGQRSL